MSIATHTGDHVATAATAEAIQRFSASVFEPTDIVEVRILPQKRSTWHTAADLPKQAARLLKANGAGQNIYVGANPRRATGGTTADDVLLARCLFADFDGIDLDEARRRWEAAGLPEPTLIILSGRGVHCYWRLTESLVDLDEFTTLQKAIIVAVGGDPVIHDPPRIMRLPGFINRKEDKPPVPCSIVEADPERRYPLADLRGILAKHRAAQNGSHGATTGTARKSTNGDTLGRLAEAAQRYAAKVPGVAEGGRNAAAFSHAGHLAAFEVEGTGERLTVEQIANVLRGWNLKNSPPLLDAELCAAAASGTTNGTPRAPHVVKASRATTRPAINAHASAAPSSNGEAESDNEPRTFQTYSPAQLAALDLSTEFLIDGVLARRQPGLVAGVFKTLKTSIAADAALSIATATPFLGTFRVSTAARVLFMSAESGLKKLRDTFQRIATARGIEFSDIGPTLMTCPVVPMLGNILDHDALERTAKELEAEVIMIDPGYRAMAAIGNDAGNVFKVGALLSHVDEIAERTGTTILIVHHCGKHTAANFEAPELRHVSMSGFAEWARQWLLLGPRAAWTPDTGQHRLWFTYGGSEGHAGAWGLDVREGRHGDPGGQVWDTSLLSMEEVRMGTTDRREAAREEKRTIKADRDKRTIAAALIKTPEGNTIRGLRDATGINQGTIDRLLVDLETTKDVRRCTLVKGNNKQEHDGWQLVTDTTDTTG